MFSSSRKRRKPACLDLTAKVPRHSSIPGAEATHNVSTSSNDTGQDHHFLLPLTKESNSQYDILRSNYNLTLHGPRKEKSGKEAASPVLCDDPLPHAGLCAATLASMTSVSAPRETSYFICAVPVLHPHMYHTSIKEKILRSRQCTSVEGQEGCSFAEKDKCVYVGDIVMGLVVPRDMEVVFEVFEGKMSVQLSLVLDRGLDGEGDENVGQWLLKLEVGETINYLLLKMDPRFSGIPCQVVGKMLQKTSSLMKLFLAQTSESCALHESLRLEVWSLNVMSHSGSAFELGPKLTNQPFYTLLVNTLYQAEVVMDSDEGALCRVVNDFVCSIWCGVMDLLCGNVARVKMRLCGHGTAQ